MGNGCRVLRLMPVPGTGHPASGYTGLESLYRMPEIKTIVITGASAGIGAAIAYRLAYDGHRLVLTARRNDALHAVATEAEQRGAARTLVVPADATNHNAVYAVRDSAISTFGGFDVWINNAGRGITRSVLDLTANELDEMMTANTKSALYGMQAAAAHFLERGSGHLINISSFLGRVPLAAHRSAYNAAKAALNALTANMRVELHARNPAIHTTLVMPGLVATEFARNTLGGSRDAEIPSGDAVQTAEQVADLIADVIAHPKAEVYTNPDSQRIASEYFADVGGFEARAAHPWRLPPGRAETQR
jgi:short-subunit dehydrogenase